MRPGLAAIARIDQCPVSAPVKIHISFLFIAKRLLVLPSPKAGYKPVGMMQSPLVDHVELISFFLCGKFFFFSKQMKAFLIPFLYSMFNADPFLTSTSAISFPRHIAVYGVTSWVFHILFRIFRHLKPAFGQLPQCLEDRSLERI